MLLEKVTQRPSGTAPQHAGLLMAAIVSDVHCLPHFSLQSSNLSVFLSDCQMRFTSHMSHICRLSSLNGSVNDANASRCECRVTSVGSLPHLEVPAIQVICRCCFCSPDLLQSVKNWCQHLSKAKCLFYTECQSSHNLLINQAAKKQILCVCVWLLACLSLCVSAHVQQRLIQVYYSAIFERGL